MADEADLSDETIQQVVDAGVEQARANLMYRDLLPIKACHYCSSPVTGLRLFCPDNEDGSCASDWEHEYKRKKDLGL